MTIGLTMALSLNVRNGWKADISSGAVFCYLYAVIERSEAEAWMALLHVRPQPGRTNPLDGTSGLGWVLALATDADDYLRLVTAEMESIGLFIAEADDLGRYSEFEMRSDDIVESFERLSDEWPVQYHTFHTPNIDDA